MNSAPGTRDIDEYIAQLPAKARTTLEKLRRAIRAAAPDAEEGRSYGMPAFLLDGPLVAYAAHKDHCGFYPMSPAVIEAHASELKDYDTSKGTIRIPLGKSLPSALVKKLVVARIVEKAGKTKPRSARYQPSGRHGKR